MMKLKLVSFKLGKETAFGRKVDCYLEAVAKFPAAGNDLK